MTKTMTAQQLLQQLLALKSSHQNFAELPVYVRVLEATVDGDDAIGGLCTVAIDPGCTDDDAIMLDGVTYAIDADMVPSTTTES